jgi:hypothetical protein
MRGIMPAIIDQAGRKSTLTRPDRVNRRHSRRDDASSDDRRRAPRDSAAGRSGRDQHRHHPRPAGQGRGPLGHGAREHRPCVRARVADAGARHQPATWNGRTSSDRPSRGASACCGRYRVDGDRAAYAVSWTRVSDAGAGAPTEPAGVVSRSRSEPGAHLLRRPYRGTNPGPPEDGVATAGTNRAVSQRLGSPGHRPLKAKRGFESRWSHNTRGPVDYPD